MTKTELAKALKALVTNPVLIERIAEIMEDNRRLREALEFYADEDNHYRALRRTNGGSVEETYSSVMEDLGRKARQALGLEGVLAMAIKLDKPEPAPAFPVVPDSHPSSTEDYLAGKIYTAQVSGYHEFTIRVGDDKFHGSLNLAKGESVNLDKLTRTVSLTKEMEE